MIRLVLPQRHGTNRETLSRSRLALSRKGAARVVDRPKTPSELQGRAAECERLAYEMINPADRETMLDVAQRWRALTHEDDVQARAVSNVLTPNPPSDP
jgi:hypothetical protein